MQRCVWGGGSFCIGPDPGPASRQGSNGFRERLHPFQKTNHQHTAFPLPCKTGARFIKGRKVEQTKLKGMDTVREEFYCQWAAAHTHSACNFRVNKFCILPQNSICAHHGENRACLTLLSIPCVRTPVPKGLTSPALGGTRGRLHKQIKQVLKEAVPLARCNPRSISRTAGSVGNHLSKLTNTKQLKIRLF